MEAVYRMERTWQGSSLLLSSRWFITSGPGPRFPIARIDTSAATARFNRTPEPKNLSIDSPSPSTRDTAGEFTPCPSPSTAFTTPTTSPLRDEKAKPHPTPQKSARDIDRPNSGIDGVMSDAEALKACIDVWVRRYVAEVVLTRQLQEELHKSGGQLAEAEGLEELLRFGGSMSKVVIDMEPPSVECENHTH